LGFSAIVSLGDRLKERERGGDIQVIWVGREHPMRAIQTPAADWSPPFLRRGSLRSASSLFPISYHSGKMLSRSAGRVTFLTGKRLYLPRCAASTCSCSNMGSSVWTPTTTYNPTRRPPSRFAGRVLISNDCLLFCRILHFPQPRAKKTALKMQIGSEMCLHDLLFVSGKNYNRILSQRF